MLRCSWNVFFVFDSFFNDCCTPVSVLSTAAFYIESESYFVGERDGTLTVRIRRSGYLFDAATVSVGEMTIH